MKLILFGDIPNWNRSIQLLQTYRPDIFIAGLSSVSLGQFASSSVTYTPEETAVLYRSHQIDGVINIQGENPYYFRLLKELGIENIYVITRNSSFPNPLTVIPFFILIKKYSQS